MLEKQYSRIIRWVHRAQSMSADGNFSDAILDVECARAELEDARQELLLCHKSGAEKKGLPSYILVLTGAAAAVLSWATPLHVADVRPMQASAILLPGENGPIITEAVVPSSVEPVAEIPENRVVFNPGPEQKEVFAHNAFDRTFVFVTSEYTVNDGMEAKQPAPSAAVIMQNKITAQRKSARNLSVRVSQKLSADDMYRLTEVGRKALRRNKNAEVWELN